MRGKIECLTSTPFLCISFFILFLSFSVLNATTHVIEFGGTLGNTYSPDDLSVEVGDTVTWIGTFSSHPLKSTSVPQDAATFENNSGTSFSYLVQVAGSYDYECVLHSSLGMTGSFTATVSSIDDDLSMQPDVFHLEQNYPNPFNPTTVIGYRLSAISNVELSVYNALGQRVAILVSGEQQAGSYEVQWDAEGYSSGVYFYHLRAAEFESVKRMVLMK